MRKLFVLALFVLFAATSGIAWAEDVGNYELHDFSLWALDPTLDQANQLQHYPSALPGVVETDRTRVNEQKKPTPLGLITFHGEPIKDIEVDLRVQSGRFLGHWPPAESKSGRLRWLELGTVAEAAKGALMAAIDDKHWFATGRQLDALFAEQKGRTERFLVYDFELKYDMPIQLTGGPDTYQIGNRGKTPLVDVMILVPHEDGLRIGRLETLAPALQGAQAAKPAEPKPADGKPAESKPGEAKPGESKPAAPTTVEKVPEIKPAEEKPAEKKTDEKPPAESKTEEKPGDPLVADKKDDKKDEKKPDQPAERKSDEKPAAEKAEETKAEKPAAAAAVRVVAPAGGAAAGVVVVGQAAASGQPIAGAQPATAAPAPEPAVVPSVELVMSAPIARNSAEVTEARDALKGGLLKAGLTEKEAELLLARGEGSIFDTKEMIVVFRLPPDAIEERLPLVCYPAPRKTVRAAVILVRNLDPKLKDEVGRLVGDLGNDKYPMREAAEKRLLELGRLAVPALKVALKSPDLEVVFRAERILLAQNEKLE